MPRSCCSPPAEEHANALANLEVLGPAPSSSDTVPLSSPSCGVSSAETRSISLRRPFQPEWLGKSTTHRSSWNHTSRPTDAGVASPQSKRGCGTSPRTLTSGADGGARPGWAAGCCPSEDTVAGAAAAAPLDSAALSRLSDSSDSRRLRGIRELLYFFGHRCRSRHPPGRGLWHRRGGGGMLMAPGTRRGVAR